MNELLNSLIEKNDIQRDALLGLLEVLHEEKEILRKGKPNLIPALLQRLQDVASRAMLAEAERNRAAATFAEALGCEPVVRQICSVLDEENARRLQKSARNLLSAVISIKEINFTLSKQAEEHRFLSDMILERMKHFVKPGQAAASLDTTA